ncbi:MAG: TIR domain-containing protein [Thermodesulfobacteriota bacterium]
MSINYQGSLEELKAKLEEHNVKGTWSEKSDGQYQFRTQDKAIMNFWTSTGTLSFQGPSSAKQTLETSVESILNKETLETNSKSISGATVATHRIFIVHGHDSDTRDQLELALRRLGLEPYILMNTSGAGKTIIEALEGQIGKDFASDFGIVLMTPDDIGYAVKDGKEKEEPRARQNVILETGMLLSSLTRERMALIVKGHLEQPSDLQGIISFRFNDRIKEVLPKLCNRLREVGISIDHKKITEAMM